MTQKQAGNISELYKILAQSEKEVKIQSRQNYQDLWLAYNTAGDLLFKLVAQGETDPAKVSDSCSKRVSLTANLIQSTFIVERLISSGYYWAASTVLRQHMETLARVIGIREQRHTLPYKPPNVSLLPFKLPQNYGRLSELCHTSKNEILSDFSKCPEGEGVASTRPYYNKEWSINLFSLHIAHLVVLILEICWLYAELFPGRDLVQLGEGIGTISDILVRNGFWEEIE